MLPQLFDLPSSAALSPLAVEAMSHTVAFLLALATPPALAEAAALCRRMLAAALAADAAADAGDAADGAAAAAAAESAAGASPGVNESARVGAIRRTLAGYVLLCYCATLT